MMERLRNLGRRASRSSEAFGPLGLGEVGNGAAALLATLLAARFMGPAEFGRYGFLYSLLALGSAVLDLRTEELFLASLGRTAPARTRALLVAKLWSVTARTILLGALVAAATFFLEFSVGSALMLVVYFALRGLEPTAAARYSAAGEYRGLATMRLSYPIARLALVSAIRPSTTFDLAALTLAASAAGSVLAVRSLRVVWATSSSSERARVAEAVREALPYSVATSVRGVTAQMDQLVVGAVLGFEDLGRFRAAKSLASATAAAGGVLRTRYERHLVHAFATGSGSEQRSILKKMSGVGFAAGLAVIILWLVAHDLVIAVLGADYEVVVLVTLLLFVQQAIKYTTLWTKSLPAIVGHPRWALLESVTYLILGLPLVLALSFSSGAIGAASSLILTELVVGACWARAIIRWLQADE